MDICIQTHFHERINILKYIVYFNKCKKYLPEKNIQLN